MTWPSPSDTVSEVGDAETKPTDLLARVRAKALALEPDALVLPGGERMPWRDILGVVELGQARRRRLYVLARRPPPAPPWFEITPRMRHAAGITADLGQLAATMRERLGCVSYRERAGAPARLTAEELRAAVMEGTRLPGALEIVRARGPRRPLTRLVEGLAGGLAGGGAGFFFGAFIGAFVRGLLGAQHGIGAALQLGFTTGGALVGLALSLPSRSFITRVRGHRARVLVLTPDGCVVGLPEGPRAFAWSSIAAFTIAPLRQLPARHGLRLVDSAGHALGELDRAWFDGPLELVVAVANAYRARMR